MLKIAVIGCGKIADAHGASITKIKDCQIVGVTDSEPLMARQFGERFHVKGIFDSLESLLLQARPDVVHITTSPQSHYSIAKACLENGCHVYVEKPFTVNTQEAEELIRLSQDANVKLTVGHDDQFSPVARRLRTLVISGYLGGWPVHMESYYGYELSGAYANAVLGDKKHWVRNLPGRLLQNIISHGIARIAEYLKSDRPTVIAHGFTSPGLRTLGEEEIVDELRVIISENGETTAYFTFSSQMRPSLHQFRVFGPRNGVILDHDNQTLIRLRGKRFTSYAEYFLPPMIFAKQYLANFSHNSGRFLKRRFHSKEGMRWLIESFYRSIIDDKPLPIPNSEILRVSRIMDEIFRQLNGQSLRADGSVPAKINLAL